MAGWDETDDCFGYPLNQLTMKDNNLSLSQSQSSPISYFSHQHQSLTYCTTAVPAHDQADASQVQ